MINRFVPLFALAALACADNAIGPSGLYPGYSLATINGQFLPTRDGDTPADAEMISAGLLFDEFKRARDGTPRTVSYTRWFRRPSQPLERVTVDLFYRVEDGVLRIDLCPPRALCIIATELVGPVGTFDLVLTHYLNRVPGTVYRFDPALPE